MKDLLGKTILLKNYRNDGVNRLVKVTFVRDTHLEPITLRTRQQDVMTRGRYLITGNNLDKGAMRSYYIDHGEWKVVGWFGRLYHKVFG
jgi:hypothetical protein